MKNFLTITNHFKKSIQTATFKDSAIVFSGNLISSILGAIFFFLLAHKLGPYNFGLFSVVIAIALTVVDLFDIAINNAIVSFGSKIEHTAGVLKRGLRDKIILSGLSIIFLWILAFFIARILNRPEIVGPLRLAIWLIPAKSCFSFVKTALQTIRNFLLDAVVDILSTIIRIGGFFLILFLGYPALTTGIIAYIAGLVISAVIAVPIIVKLIKQPSQPIEHKKIAAYQSWMTLSFIASAISARLDIFFLTRFTSLEIVGWYQAAFRLFMPVQQLASSLSRVFAPRLAHFTSSEQVRTYMKKAVSFSLILAFSILLTIPVFPLLVPILYGNKFFPAVNISWWLMGYFMIFLAATPWWSQLLYYYRDAKKFTLLSIFQLLILFILMPPAALNFGIAGISMSLMVSALIVTLLAVWSMKKGDSL